jgi:allantoinase
VVAFAAWMCERPARFAGLADRKGRIERGMDADLVIWDPEATHAVSADELEFKHKVSPYLGRKLRGVVHETWLRGQRVYEHGDVVETPRGRPVLGRAKTE